MQPAPLAGTATLLYFIVVETYGDATCTPRGDGNASKAFLRIALTSRCNPHPSRGQQRASCLDSRPRNHFKMQSTPPYGDGNPYSFWQVDQPCRCSPHPSRGRQLQIQVYYQFLHCRCNPHPSRGRQPLDGNDLRQTAEEMQPAPLTGTATSKGSYWLGQN